MCYFNDRKTKRCTANPKHTFREILLCDGAKNRGNVACPEDTWEDLHCVMKTTATLDCAICNGLRYVIQQAEPEQAVVE